MNLERDTDSTRNHRALGCRGTGEYDQNLYLRFDRNNADDGIVSYRRQGQA
jgi:hypothetical protein